MGRHLSQNVNLPLDQRVELLNTTGLVAGFTGAVNDAVLLFAGAGGAIGPAAFMRELNDANAGTSVEIFKPGVYDVKLYIEGVGAVTLDYGISQDVGAAGLTGDPSFAIAGFLDVQHAVGLAASTFPLEVSTTLVVSPEQETGPSVIRFHATNGAGAAPAGGSIVIASCYYRVRRINQAHV